MSYFSKFFLLVGLALVFAGGQNQADAFELESPAGTCKGHEWLSVAAAKAVGISGKYHRSMEYGARYVDLGGMTFAKDWFFGKMKIYVHRGPGSAHNHFCLRGGASDLTDLIRDSAARIREVLLLALNQPDSRKETIVDGGMVSASNKSVYLRYFLLGAALHTLQDSFAHGYRNPVWGKLASSSMKSRWGGTNGKTFRAKGYYTRIVKAVLVPDPAKGTATHNEVYSKSEGAPHKSDKIWNATLCQVAKREHGRLMPHAFAAYLASRDFLAVFRDAAKQKSASARTKTADRRLGSFMGTWFRNASGKFPGYGAPQGKCQGQPVDKCPRLLLPSEKGYVKPKISGAQDAAKAGASYVGKKISSGAKKAGKKISSGAKKAGKKISSGAKKAGKKISSGAKKIGKKLKFW